MEKGFIKLHRSLLEWEWYDDLTTFKLFIHCLLMANYKDKKWHGEVIKRGSFITSLEKLADENGMTVQNVRTSIKKLEATQEITYVGSKKGSIISIKNYDKYQDVTYDSTRYQQDTNKIVTTTKERKKERKERSVCVPTASTLTHTNFDRFFEEYPTNEFEDDCRKYWIENIPEDIQQHVIDSVKWNKERGMNFKKPLYYLKDRMYKSYIEYVKKQELKKKGDDEIWDDL